MTKTLKKTNKEQKDTTQVNAIVFVKSEIHAFLSAADMTDGDHKIFGAFQEVSYITTTKVDAAYRKRMIKQYLKHPDIYFVTDQHYFAIKPGIHALSLGKRGIWVDDLRESALQAGVKEVKC